MKTSDQKTALDIALKIVSAFDNDEPIGHALEIESLADGSYFRPRTNALLLQLAHGLIDLNRYMVKRWDYPSAIEDTTAEKIAAWLDAHDAVGPDRLSNIAKNIRAGKWKDGDE